jgi:pimeloyl-ACP methyl ester carboxylesterase
MDEQHTECNFRFGRSVDSHEHAEQPDGRVAAQISAPTTVLIGDHEVIYRGGPEAALARAKTLIPNVRTELIPGANHILTLDAPEAVVAEMTAALT